MKVDWEGYKRDRLKINPNWIPPDTIPKWAKADYPNPKFNWEGYKRDRKILDPNWTPPPFTPIGKRKVII